MHGHVVPVIENDEGCHRVRHGTEPRPNFKSALQLQGRRFANDSTGQHTIPFQKLRILVTDHFKTSHSEVMSSYHFLVSDQEFPAVKCGPVLEMPPNFKGPELKRVLASFDFVPEKTKREK